MFDGLYRLETLCGVGIAKRSPQLGERGVITKQNTKREKKKNS